MRVAVGQFAAAVMWSANATTCVKFIDEAGHSGADLLVLPEAVLAYVPDDQARTVSLAQPLDGPFVTELKDRLVGSSLTVVVGVYERTDGGQVANTLVVLRDGKILTTYRKLHLYDAFSNRESDLVEPGQELPPVFDVKGWKVGLMTCYDVRFPEVARNLIDRGAEIIALPAAWARGPQKERHWEVMVAARALENVCFVLAADECSPNNVGSSMIVDPLGRVRAQLSADAGMVNLDIGRDELEVSRRTLPVLMNRRLHVESKVYRSRSYKSAESTI